MIIDSSSLNFNRKVLTHLSKNDPSLYHDESTKRVINIEQYRYVLQISYQFCDAQYDILYNINIDIVNIVDL